MNLDERRRNGSGRRGPQGRFPLDRRGCFGASEIAGNEMSGLFDHWNVRLRKPDGLEL